MHARTSDCTIERALNDPMTAAIMRADGVDRAALRDLLRQAASHVAPARPSRFRRAMKATLCAW